MRKAILTRLDTGDAGTFGHLLTDSGFTCCTGELPWRDNQADISCIPTGTYTVNWRLSPKHGMCYHVDTVPNRSDIEIHAANYMGDKAKGFRCELEGCIAPGHEIVDDMEGQKGIGFSKAALAGLLTDMAEESFLLEINWGN